MDFQMIREKNPPQIITVFAQIPLKGYSSSWDWNVQNWALKITRYSSEDTAAEARKSV